MESDRRDGELLQRLLEEPAQYEEIAINFDDDKDCFYSLRDTAKESLKSFEEFFGFYQSYIEGGPVDVARYHLERNAAREIKNMVLRDSQVGRRFPIWTAAELDQRINEYRELGNSVGLENITPREVAFTTIEHIVDKDRHREHGYDVINNLLEKIPESPTVAIEIFVRARFVLATETLQSDSDAYRKYVEELFSDLPDPFPEDDRNATELLDAADDKKYEDPEKLKLTQASLARQGNIALLQDYLYLSLTDVVERYRHESRKHPWRGELELAVKQANCLKNAFGDDIEISGERAIRIEPYQKVALGELASGGRWRSQRDPQDLPDPDFFDAFQHFLDAAHEIQPIDKSRYIKYLSKSFRHFATAAIRRRCGPAQGWITSQQIHELAISVVSEVVSDETPDSLTQTITETIALHKFKAHEAGVVVAFERNNPNKMREQANKAWDLIDAVPVYLETDVLETGSELADVLQLEDGGQIDEAIYNYENVSNPKFDLERRKKVAKVKQELMNRNHESVFEMVSELLDDNQ